jgi:hypothetical protein
MKQTDRLKKEKSPNLKSQIPSNNKKPETKKPIGKK